MVESAAQTTRDRSTQQCHRACEELERVALMTGLGPKEVEATIRSGYTAGLHGRGGQS